MLDRSSCFTLSYGRKSVLGLLGKLLQVSKAAAVADVVEMRLNMRWQYKNEINAQNKFNRNTENVTACRLLQTKCKATQRHNLQRM